MASSSNPLEPQNGLLKVQLKGQFGSKTLRDGVASFRTQNLLEISLWGSFLSKNTKGRNRNALTVTPNDSTWQFWALQGLEVLVLKESNLSPGDRAKSPLEYKVQPPPGLFESLVFRDQLKKSKIRKDWCWSARQMLSHSGNSDYPLRHLLVMLLSCNCEKAHLATLGICAYPSGMRIWVQPAGGPPLLVQVKVEDEGNLERTVEEKEDEC